MQCTYAGHWGKAVTNTDVVAVVMVVTFYQGARPCTSQEAVNYTWDILLSYTVEEAGCQDNAGKTKIRQPIPDGMRVLKGG